VRRLISKRFAHWCSCPGPCCASPRRGLMASLLYGSGLRLLECAGLRSKDIDFGNEQILIRRGKGGKERVTLLPASLEQPYGIRSPLCAANTKTIFCAAPGFGPPASIQKRRARRTPDEARDLSLVSAIHSRLTCSNQAATFARSKSCSVTETLRPR
jgi:site-specific recombinase XerC